MAKKEFIKINLIFTIILLSMMLSVYADEVKTITIPKSTTTNYNPYVSFTLNLKKGDKVAGSFSVQGGYKIDFGVAESNFYNAILSLKSTNGSSFEFTARRDGVYFLVFAHPGGYGNEKTVILSYNITRPGSSDTSTPSNPLFTILIIIIIVLAISLGFSTYKIKKSKKQVGAC
ncbi:MAG: hypothetical protein QXQ61_02270 [Candidatus Bathyarchaeia archaeon]